MAAEWQQFVVVAVVVVVAAVVVAVVAEVVAGEPEAAVVAAEAVVEVAVAPGFERWPEKIQIINILTKFFLSSNSFNVRQLQLKLA